MIELTRDEQRLIDDNGSRLVRRIVAEETPLAYLVYKIATKDREFTTTTWQKVLAELDAEDRKLYDWVQAKMEEAENAK